MRYRLAALGFGIVAAFQMIMAIAAPDVNDALLYGAAALVFAWASGDVSRMGSTSRRLGLGKSEADKEVG